MLDNKALKELDRVAGMVAFSVKGWYAREKINQHSTRYLFNDGSKLVIKHTLRIGEAWYQCTKVIKDLNINQRGV